MNGNIFDKLDENIVFAVEAREIKLCRKIYRYLHFFNNITKTTVNSFAHNVFK